MFTSEANTATPIRPVFREPLRWVFRAAIALNFVRFALSFVPSFEGTEEKPGFIDRLFGNYTALGFFRPDFAWLIVSTMIIFGATFYFARISKDDPKTRLDAILCLAWTVAFGIYLIRSVATGVLFPG